MTQASAEEQCQRQGYPNCVGFECGKGNANYFSQILGSRAELSTMRTAAAIIHVGAYIRQKK